MTSPIEVWNHPACMTDEQILADCTIGRGRTGGPGGQHRNKVETLIELHHKPTGITAKAGERRSPSENKSVALRRLRLELATHHRLGAPRGEIGSKLWKSRTKAGRIVCNPRHRDYPSLLAEALDVLESGDWDPPHAALRLGVSASQIVRLVADHPEALSVMNANRMRLGKRPLRA